MEVDGDGLQPDTASDSHIGGADNGLSDKDRDQLEVQASAFEALERDFGEFLEELVADKSLDRFRGESVHLIVLSNSICVALVHLLTPHHLPSLFCVPLSR